MKSLHELRQRPQVHTLPKLRGGILMAGCCFAVSGATLFGKPLPLAACVVAAQQTGFQPLFAAFGAICGYFLRCEASFAAEYTALTLLMLAAIAVFQGTSLPTMRLFMPLMAASVSAVLGGISVMGGDAQISFLIVKVLLSGLATMCFRRIFAGDRSQLVLLAAAVVSGLCGIVPWVDVGLLAACGLCAFGGEMNAAICLALALDLAGAYGMCVLPSMVLATMLRKRLPQTELLLSSLTFLLIPSSVFLCCGRLTFGLFASLACGSVVGCVCRRIAPQRAYELAQEHTDSRLAEAAQVLQMLRGCLSGEAVSIGAAEAEEVYDAAAERVCRCCPRFHRCWEQRAASTYETLCAAAHSIIERGVAQTEDFAAEFREQCCHLEGFVLAVNQELEGMLYRRRYRMQLQESRQIFAQQLQHLSDYLTTLQDERPTVQTAYVPIIGVCAMGKHGRSVNGDTGAYFAGANGDYYVLLCDGMGSGTQASAASAQAVRFLQKLLKSGLAPQAAMQLLNGAQILSGTGCYTTLDLLHIDLNTATARLYKWGAAASFLRHFDEVKRLDAQTPPPGFSIAQAPQQYSFCLKREELFVLASDGADAEQVEQTLGSYRGQCPRELAALLAACTHNDDDMTAVTICLRPRHS